MELDATRRRPGFNISAKEYQRRMRSNLCLKCAKPGHRALACRKCVGMNPGQQQGGSDMGTKEREQETMETTSQSQGNRGRQGGRIGKRRKSPVSNGLRDRTKPKPIEMRNLYAALNNTEALNNENDHIMVTIRLHGTTRQITIKAMIDLGATEDFINKGFCSKYNIRTTQAKTIREVYLTDGRPSAMGPITHTAKVSMDIGSHRELAIF